jgi:hypothetical protein
MTEVPLIIEALDDQKMLQFMGRENGEDYGTSFIVMLNTWEGAVKFFVKSRKKVGFENVLSGRDLDIARTLGWLTHDKDATRNNLRIPHEPLEIARLLGWTEDLGGKHLAQAALHRLAIRIEADRKRFIESLRFTTDMMLSLVLFSSVTESPSHAAHLSAVAPVAAWHRRRTGRPDRSHRPGRASPR